MKPLDVKFLKDKSKSLGFALRDEEATGAAVARIPAEMLDAKQSVCGMKCFLIDEVREFDAEPQPVRVNCASIAVLEIVDSPVHKHGETVETYLILEGTGRIVLDDMVVDVEANSVVAIPAGVEHGLTSTTDAPVKVLMTFSPGIASVEHPEFRDEKIVHESARKRAEELTGA